MPSVTLSSKGKGWFNAALFWKNVTRFWPIWVMYGAIEFFVLPMQIILVGNDYTPYANRASRITSSVYHAVEGTVYWGIAFGLIVAMALFSYLMNNRSVGMLHALPIRREGLFFTNYLSALFFLGAPSTVIAGIALCAEALQGVFLPGDVLRWLAAQVVVGMFFFSFAVFCAMFTGHILALPVFFAILNFLIMGMSFLIDNAMSTLLIGHRGHVLASTNLVRWFTPSYHLLHLLGWGPVEYAADETFLSYCPEGFAAAVAYSLILGAVFTLVALMIYRRRQLERAGDIVTVGWMRPVFQYGVGVCAGLTLGSVLYYNFFTAFGSWVFVVLVPICAILGSFSAQMLLKKSLRIFADSWKGCAILGVCVFLLLGGTQMDLFGYQRWTPDGDDVAQIQICDVRNMPYDSAHWLSLSVDDPELIEDFIQLHANLVGHLIDLKKASQEAHNYYNSDGYETFTTVSLQITYVMKSGKVIDRQYSTIPISAEALADPGSYAAQLQAFINQPALVEQSYLGSHEITEAVSGWLSTGNGQDYNLSYLEANTLWHSIQEDLAAGRLHRYLLDDMQRSENCYYNDLYLTMAYQRIDESGKRITGTFDLTLTPQKSAVSLMRALEDLGMQGLLLSRENT